MAVINAADLLPKFIQEMEMAAEINEAVKKLRNGNHDLEATIKYIKHWIPYVDAQHDKNLEMLHQGIDSCLEQVMQSQKTLSELQSLLMKQSVDKHIVDANKMDIQ
jgi:hypothetical protein